METKQIIAILAIFAVAAAGIGAAYAYQAQLYNEDNSVDAEYLELNAAAGTFARAFTNTGLEWNSETIYSGMAKYTPKGAAPVTNMLDLVGYPVSDPYVITINSSQMAAGDWYTFSLDVYDKDTTTHADLQGLYAMAFTYTTQTYNASSSEYDTAVNYYGYGIISDEKVNLFMSKDTTNGILSGETDDKQYVTLQLYAIAGQGTVPASNIDYTDKDFVFSAVASTPASEETLSIKVLNRANAAIETATTPVVFAADGALVAVNVGGSAGNFTASVPYGAGYTGYSTATGYVLATSQKGSVTTPTDLKISEAPLSIAFNAGTGEVSALDTHSTYDSNWVTAAADLKFDITYTTATGEPASTVVTLTGSDNTSAADPKVTSNAKDAIVWETAGWYKVTFFFDLNGVTVETEKWVLIKAPVTAVGFKIGTEAATESEISLTGEGVTLVLAFTPEKPTIKTGTWYVYQKDSNTELYAYAAVDGYTGLVTLLDGATANDQFDVVFVPTDNDAISAKCTFTVTA